MSMIRKHIVDPDPLIVVSCIVLNVCLWENLKQVTFQNIVEAKVIILTAYVYNLEIMQTEMF